MIAGEVFTWGSNRDGCLGYGSVDKQATPRKVASVKPRVASVAAANKHSVALTHAGESTRTCADQLLLNSVCSQVLFSVLRFFHKILFFR